MMSKQQIIKRISSGKIMAILRLKEQSRIPEVIREYLDKGIEVLEVTSNSPGFDQEIAAATKNFPEVLIGAGTIMSVELGKKAIMAGAQFLVTPNTNSEVVELAQQYDIPVIMGAMTPTEINNAIEFGADFIKLFPAGPLGIDYLQALKGPLNRVKFIAVGGIKFSEVALWLQNGVDVVGLGSSLLNVFEEPDFSIKEQILKLKK